MFRCPARKFILMISSIIVFSVTVIQVHLQDDLGIQGRLVYEHHLEDRTEVVYLDHAIRNSFPINATECFEVFTETSELQSQLLVVSQSENPTSITVYDMVSTQIVFQRSWDSSWGRCAFDLIDGHVGVAVVETDVFDYDLLDMNGDIIERLLVEGSFPLNTAICGNITCDEMDTLLTQWIPDYPSGSGWYEEDYPFWPSPYSPYIIISPYLDKNQKIEGCCGTRQTVILDVVEGEIIKILENAPILYPTSRFLSGVHILDFRFSYSGNYLFYVGKSATVYDVISDEYLVQIDLRRDYDVADVTREIVWSSDEQYVAFTIFEEGHSDKYIGVVDLQRGKLYISEMRYFAEDTPQVQDKFMWLSGQFQLVWVNPEKELIIYDIETDTTQILDDNVIWIIGS